MTVGERIKEIRKEKGLSQMYIANKMGVSQSAICQWESGRRNATLRTLYEFADILDVPISDLIYEVPYSEKLDLSQIPTIDLLKELERRCIDGSRKRF